MDVSQLTDAELREALLSHGVNAGPILKTTRGVYEKKLAKLNTNQNDSQNTSQVFEEPELVAKTNGSLLSPPAPESPIFRKSPTPAVAVANDEKEAENGEGENSDVEDYEGEESMRFLTEDEMAAERSMVKQAAPKKSKLSNLIILTIAFAAIGVFAYFLVENAEVFLAPSKSSSSSSSSPSFDDTL